MKTETREVYIAADNTEFTSKSDAFAYQAQLENEVVIDEFLSSLEDKTEQAKSRMRNDIVKFVEFKGSRDIPVEVAHDKTKALDLSNKKSEAA